MKRTQWKLSDGSKEQRERKRVAGGEQLGEGDRKNYIKASRFREIDEGYKLRKALSGDQLHILPQIDDARIFFVEDTIIPFILDGPTYGNGGVEYDGVLLRIQI